MSANRYTAAAASSSTGARRANAASALSTVQPSSECFCCGVGDGIVDVSATSGGRSYYGHSDK